MSRQSEQFNAGAMCELESHYQFLKSRIGKFSNPVMVVKAQKGKSEAMIIQQQVFGELVRLVQRLEQRRTRYPKMKVPRRVAEIIKNRT